MTEKNLRRRTKPINPINNENIISPKRKKTKSSSLIYLLIIILGIVFGLYKIFFGFIFVEYTNHPIDLPKLVNQKTSERFWGTYR